MRNPIYNFVVVLLYILIKFTVVAGHGVSNRVCVWELTTGKSVWSTDPFQGSILDVKSGSDSGRRSNYMMAAISDSQLRLYS